MRTEELHYDLPPERIAQHPADRRDASRLMVIDRATGRRRHERFSRLHELLPPGSLLVLNDTRVLPARLCLRRRSGGRIEGLFLHEPEPGTWEMMLTDSRRLRPGELLTVDPPDTAGCERGPVLRLSLIGRREAGIWHARPLPAGEAHSILMQYGRPPLPPYIKRDRRGSIDEEETENEKAGKTSGPVDNGPEEHGPRGIEGRRDCANEGRSEICNLRSELAEDIDRYQTIYARQPGAVAAPTAGLHFTPEVFAALTAAGMSTAFVTLHVGVGTFAPIRCARLADHPMHAEWYECPEPTALAVNAARRAGRRIVAVGTTSVRVLETCADDAGRLRPGACWTRLFIYPPYPFKAVDAMLTNFHLPGSTLLAMVFAFAGRKATLAAYEEALRTEYRFYSYGDAMLIL